MEGARLKQWGIANSARMRNEAKRLYLDASYSSGGHYEDAATQSRWAFNLGLPIAIAGGISAAAAGATFLLSNNDVVAGILAFSSAVLTSVHGFVQPEKNAEAHGVKAARYNAIRDDARCPPERDPERHLRRDA